MKDADKTRSQLIEELQRMQRRVNELEQRISIEKDRSVHDETMLDEDKLLHDISRMVKIGAWRFYPETQTTNWTEEVTRIFDLDREQEINPGNVSRCFHGESLEKVERAFAEAVEHGTPYDLELEIISAKGTHKWIRTICHPVLEDGRVVLLRGSLQDVTEQKQLEQSLRLTQFIFDKAPIGIWRMEKNGGVLDVNEQGCKSLGYTHEELCGMDIFTIAHGFSREDWAEGLSILDELGSRTVEGHHRHRTGKVFPVQVIENLMKFDEQEFHVAFVQDISKRIQREKILREKDQLLQEIGRMVQIGGWKYDLETGRIRSTDEVARIHDLDPKVEITLESGLKCFPGENRKKLEQAIAHAVESGISYDLELEFISTKGNHKWVRTIGTPVMRDGRAVQLQGSLQDITEKKQAEILLRESEKRYQSLIELSPLGVGVVDAQGTIIDVNQSFASMLGYKTAELLGLSFGYITHPDDLHREHELLQSLKEDKKASYSLEKRYGHRNGHYFWIHITVAKVSDIYGPGVFYFGFVKDISDRKKMEQERENLILDLQTALAEIKELRGYLPICSGCKKIRDDEGYWQQVEKYIMDRTDARFSHALCPECAKVLYPDIFQEIETRKTQK